MSVYEAKKYLQYRLKAGNEHSIHSPFVFKLYTEAIKNKSKYYAYEELDKIRAALLQDHTLIEITDLGAGSKKLKQARKIAEIAKISVVQKKYGELLFRLVNYFQPKTILELGTSLGLSAMYMSKAAPGAEIITAEGCPNTFQYARSLISKYETQNIKPINSSFEEVFKDQSEKRNVDFVYIDGNHTYEATIKYLHELLEITNENSILVFDDIYWSPGMTKAWNEIKEHAAVTVTIDLFKMGLVFFRKENKHKENFCLRY
ncbi:MAG TPA: class I SAM-dependent methyltransferase [Bacteroidia bacterium]|jgi:predicted O-methyltransferase YrrM|nr:class I SAM-dependent methyltransferase [Bacteroidia bacterium]